MFGADYSDAGRGLYPHASDPNRFHNNPNVSKSYLIGHSGSCAK